MEKNSVTRKHILFRAKQYEIYPTDVCKVIKYTSITWNRFEWIMQ